jgi:hypothetical protein
LVVFSSGSLCLSSLIEQKLYIHGKRVIFVNGYRSDDSSL